MRLALCAVLGAAAACNDKNPASVDAPVAIDAPRDASVVVVDTPMVDGGNPLTPDTLAGTGLCTNAACTTFSADVHEYAPRFTLWADGATKRRWFSIPAGTKIDTSDMNYWKFPIGTKFWKEFTRDGVRVETRYIVKLDDEAVAPPAVSWFYVSYEWNATQDATTAQTMGVMNANGTNHDIPSRQQCKQCHESLKGTDLNRGRVLGFGAISLDFDGGYDLEDLISGNLLTDPPTTGTAHARFVLPGTATEIAAYGYLHANCGHCHNPTSNTFNGVTPMVLRYDTTKLASVSVMPQFTTTVGVTGAVPISENGTAYSKIVIPQDIANSTMIVRMNSTQASHHMPQIGSEVVDPTGQSVLTAWINSLQ